MTTNDIPRAKFIDVIQRHGHTIVDDPWELEQVLRAELADYKPERAVLVAAAKERVPADLRAATGGVPSTSLRANLAARLRDHRGITNDLALWAVDVWAAALGVTPSGTQAAFPAIRPPRRERPRETPVSDVWTNVAPPEQPHQPPDDWVGDDPQPRREPKREPPVRPALTPADHGRIDAQLKMLWYGVIAWGVNGLVWASWLKSVRVWNDDQAGGFATLAVIFTVIFAIVVRRRSTAGAWILVGIQSLNVFGSFGTGLSLVIFINLVFLVVFIVGARAVAAWHSLGIARPPAQEPPQ
jgi:hypothetical protein